MAIYKPIDGAERKGLGYYAKHTFIKFGFVFGFAIGASAYEPLHRFWDSVRYPNLPVEEGYFPDGRGLQLEQRVNERGKREWHLRHQNHDWPLTYEFLKLKPKEGADDNEKN